MDQCGFDTRSVEAILIISTKNKHSFKILRKNRQIRRNYIVTMVIIYRVHNIKSKFCSVMILLYLLSVMVSRLN